MPIRQDLLWAGSTLLIALYVADWLLPKPVALTVSQISPHSRSTSRFTPIKPGQSGW